MRLLAFPPAGGAAHLFAPWATMLPLDVELVALELPGHGTRLTEKPITEMADLLAGLMPELAALPALPTAVLGHSMGAIVALTVCRRLREVDPAWRPEVFFVVGSEARHSRRTVDDLAGASPAQLGQFLVDAHGGAGGAADPALQDLVMPGLRADLVLLAGHRPLSEAPLHCRVRVLSGADDGFVTADDRLDWAAESDGDFAVHTFPGGHFFYADPETAMTVLERVGADLNRLARRAGA
jgi:surfactin synthase thioesterase subunit